MRPRSALLLASAFASGLVAFAPARASAYERQWHAGASLGYALVHAYDASLSGFGGGLHLTYGLTDAFNLMLETNVSVHPGGDLFVAGAAAGPAYVLDVLQWVPYIGVLVGVDDVWYHYAGCGTGDQPPCHAAHLGLGFPVGLDYQVSRSFALGVQGRYTVMLFGASSPVSYVTAFARAEYIWGF